MQTVYLHGANSTGISFNYIMQNLPEHRKIVIEYSCDSSLKKICESVEDAVIASVDINKPFTIIGHSLGGIIGAYVFARLHKNEQIKPVIEQCKLVTLASPFGGSKAATFIRWFFPGDILYRDIAHNGHGVMSAIRKSVLLRNLGAQGRILPMVAHSEHPIFNKLEPGDSVVTVRSQKSMPEWKYEAFQYNHFEILQAPDVADRIKEFVFTKQISSNK